MLPSWPVEISCNVQDILCMIIWDISLFMQIWLGKFVVNLEYVYKTTSCLYTYQCWGIHLDKHRHVQTHKHTIIAHQHVDICCRSSHLHFAEKELNYGSRFVVAYAPCNWQPWKGIDENWSMSNLMLNNGYRFHVRNSETYNTALQQFFSLTFAKFIWNNAGYYFKLVGICAVCWVHAQNGAGILCVQLFLPLCLND